MLKFIAIVIVPCYYASFFFVLGIIYALPVLQAKLRVKQESVFKAILITIAYHIFVVTVLYLLSRGGLSEVEFLYASVGFLMFYFICLFGWFILRG